MFKRQNDKRPIRPGETLIAALNFFVSSVNTLCHKTIEDTITTVRQYETSRLEYDAYRSDLEFFASAPKTDVNASKHRDTQVGNVQKPDVLKVISCTRFLLDPTTGHLREAKAGV